MKDKLPWQTNVQYVDIDTGEMLTKEEANRNYITIKSTKDVKRTFTKGIVTITKHCKRTKQLGLFTQGE